MGDQPFTDYLRALGPRGEPPTREAFDEVWRKLRHALRREIRRRGLWDQPPRFLGFPGSERWDDDALDEAATEAYAFNFIDRLRPLKAQLGHKPNVEGLVVRNLRNLLHERQKGNDPLGFRVYEIVRSAVRGKLDRGELEVRSGSPRVRNDTVLAWPDPPPDAVPLESQTVDLEGRVRVWNDELLPDLLTARGGRRDRLVERLADRIDELAREEGADSFTFGTLVTAMKTDVRARWSALHLQEQGEVALDDTEEAEDGGLPRMVRLYRPDPELEDRQAFRRLTDCISRGVEHEEATDGKRGRYLSELWQFLRLEIHTSGEVPSRRRLSDLLDIPRDRFPELYGLLGELLEICREAILGRAPYPSFEVNPSPLSP